MPTTQDAPILTGDDIFAFRSEHHLTQRDLADLLQLHLNTVSRWEIGERPIAQSRLVSLALVALGQELRRRQLRPVVRPEEV